MGDKTRIAWSDATWNCLIGCSRVSAGCQHCYAERLVHRGLSAQHRGLTKIVNGHPAWTGEVRFVEKALDLPLRWHKPRRIFVNSLSDMFHESVSDDWLDRIFAVMALAPQHTFQILTKRPKRMLSYLSLMVGTPWRYRVARDVAWLLDDAGKWPSQHGQWGRVTEIKKELLAGRGWPLRNCWIGVSVENQETADERIPMLLETPAAVRWVSYEPALGAVDFSSRPMEEGWYHNWLKVEKTDPPIPRIDWIVVGAESGPGARPFNLAWARETIAQCRAAGIPVFVKQIGNRPWWNGVGPPPPEHVYRQPGIELNGIFGWQFDCLRSRAGSDPDEWPADLRIQEWPTL